MPQPNTDRHALLKIQKLMDGREWEVDDLDMIADIMVQAGYTIRDMNDFDEDGNLKAG